MTSIIPSSTPQLYSQPKKGFCKHVDVDKKSLAYIIHSTERFSKFSHLLKKSDIDIFSGHHNYTIFVPSNEAFERFNHEYVDKLTSRLIILSSTLHDKISSELLGYTPISVYNTLNPIQKLTVNVDDSNDIIQVKTKPTNPVNVIETDLIATNGVIHVVDSIIIPYLI